MLTRICILVLLILSAMSLKAGSHSDLGFILNADNNLKIFESVCYQDLLSDDIFSPSLKRNTPWYIRITDTIYQQGLILHLWSSLLMFKISMFLLLVLLGYFVYLYRVRRLERHSAELEILVKQRTSELEEKNAMLMHNSEELNEINALLEERQQYIEEQTEEIRINNEWLTMLNEKMQEQGHIMEETNKALVLSNATKDKLFSIIAHDLKNPFSSIMNFSEILDKKSSQISAEKKQKFIHAIYESSHRVYELLENLLQWSRMQTQSMGFSPEELDIKEQIDSIILLQKHHFEEKKIAFYMNVEGSRMVFADRNMLNTVLRNLIGNAVKYTESGSIYVRVTQQGENVHICIEDTGIGISDEKLSGIFEIDSKKSTPGTKGENGSGLGLILCRDFIEANGGKITVKSKQGSGTVISFTLPCNPNEIL